MIGGSQGAARLNAVVPFAVARLGAELALEVRHQAGERWLDACRQNYASAQVRADVRAFMGAKVYDTIIPRNVRVSEAPSHGKPVLLYDLRCVGSQAYIQLAKEVLKREQGKAA